MSESKKSWADEPTPLCEKAAVDGEVAFIDAARDLERRLRHAWKLVNSLRIDAMHGELDCECAEQRLADIEEVLQ